MQVVTRVTQMEPVTLNFVQQKAVALLTAMTVIRRSPSEIENLIRPARVQFSTLILHWLRGDSDYLDLLNDLVNRFNCAAHSVRVGPAPSDGQDIAIPRVEYERLVIAAQQKETEGEQVTIARDEYTRLQCGYDFYLKQCADAGVKFFFADGESSTAIPATHRTRLIKLMIGVLNEALDPATVDNTEVTDKSIEVCEHLIDLFKLGKSS